MNSHHQDRVNGDLCCELRLIPPTQVMPFVKRQKNDTTDAKAIAEVASRLILWFVTVKSEAQRVGDMAYRTLRLLVRPCPEAINAFRGTLADKGIMAPIGTVHVGSHAIVVDGEVGI